MSVNNFSSPFFTNQVTVGQQGHLSNVAVIYTPKSIPTSWPIVVSGALLTLITASWTIIRINKSSRRWWSALIFTVVNLIRGLSSLITVAKAYSQLDNPDGPGRWLPVSMLGAFTLACLPFSLKTPHPFKLFGVLTGCMALTSFVLMLVVQWQPAVGGLVPYGGVEIAGGNCPVFVGSCDEDITGTLHWTTLAGCGWPNMTTVEPEEEGGYVRPNFTSTTAVGEGEKYSSMVLLGLMILLFSPVIWVSPLLLYALVGSLWAGTAAWARRPGFKVETEKGDGRPIFSNRAMIIMSAAQILFVLSVGLVSASLHVATESPARVWEAPTAYAIVDSFGPPRNLAVESAGDSWSDCFVVELPTDGLGFIDEWWAAHKTQPETWLGMT